MIMDAWSFGVMLSFPNFQFTDHDAVSVIEGGEGGRQERKCVVDIIILLNGEAGISLT